MAYRLLADAVLLLHLGFILFAIFGGLAALRWRWIVWLHLPSVVWAVVVEAAGWVCPLTPLENHLRLAAGQLAYAGGFVEHYLLPVLYPASMTRAAQMWLAVALLAFNVSVYLLLWWRWGVATGRYPSPQAALSFDEVGVVSSRTMFGVIVAMQSGVVLVALGLGALFDTPAFGGLRPSISGAVWGVVAAGPVAAFVILLVHRRIPFALRLMQTVERSLRRPLLGGSVLQMAITAALAGLGEEALFRGVLQVAIGHVANPAVGLVAASLLFGAAHWVSRLYAGIATLFGLYLGWLFLVSDSLLVPIVAHAGYDFAILVYLRRGPATVTEG